MAIGRMERRAERHALVASTFSEKQVSTVLDLFEVVDLAWHDCYGEVTPPSMVIDDLLTVAGGDLGKLIAAAHLAVTDWRDLRVTADSIRRSGGAGPQEP